MSPYEVLGVATTATPDEIKSAYRRLVKQFHPDVTQVDDLKKISELNEAYDILSDPLRKAAHDQDFSAFTYVYEEDQAEVYRREYINRKREEERIKEEEYERRLERFEKRMKIFHKVNWYLSFPILAFAIVLMVDAYLPKVDYHETGEYGYQKVYRTSRYSSRDRISYMKTEHFVIAVPDEIHVYYDYFADKKEILTISVSRIFGVPSTVSLNHRGRYSTADIGQTIFSNPFKIHYLLLIVSMFMVFRRKYSHVNFCVSCFLVPLFLLAVLYVV